MGILSSLDGFSKPAGLRVYGLTGGIATGKSEVAKVIAQSGIPVIDADAIGHELIGPGGKAAQAVVAAFGSEILTGGLIDRDKLGAIVFPVREARAKLNQILHPLIAREIEARCHELRQQNHPIAVIDAALLAEEGKKDTFLDGLIVVHCSKETQLARLTAQRRLTREEALRRIEAQCPTEYKVAVADWLIENEGTLEELRLKSRTLLEKLRGHALIQS